jgi:hypothetical protein
MSRYMPSDSTADYIMKVQEAKTILGFSPTADVVAVVRCKDCKYFQPRFVLTAEKERRPYTEEEIKNGEIVSADVGINCGSRCERFGYWEENKIPVWFSENDYCNHGERSEK